MIRNTIYMIIDNNDMLRNTNDVLRNTNDMIRNSKDHIKQKHYRQCFEHGIFWVNASWNIHKNVTHVKILHRLGDVNVEHVQSVQEHDGCGQEKQQHKQDAIDTDGCCPPAPVRNWQVFPG